jgi:signal transduction histidine kinase/HPt (histidine-containing phosphotransfer) domain-containing protein/ActR/RegA family two-component response regulator
MKLSTKFSAAVVLLLLVVLGGTAALLIRHQRRAVRAEALQRAQLVLSFGESCREYTRNTLSPKVRAAVPPGTIIFEADSATAVVRGTFKVFGRLEPAYTLREAALNPLNPDNAADAGERALVERFRADPGLKEVSGFRGGEGGEEFFVARPIVVQPACLECHRSPESAPPALVKRYGSTSGFGWQVGDVAAALVVTVPASDLMTQQAGVQRQVLWVFGGLALLLVGLLAILFERLVNSRLRQVVAGLGRLAEGPAAAPRLPTSADELGRLAAAFNQMADAVRDSHLLLEERVRRRTEELEARNRELDEARRAAEAASRAKGEFLANMSHEVRTPMNGILNLARLALASEVPATRREYLTLVQSSSAALLTVLNDVLDFSKIEAGKLDLVQAPFRPAAVIDEVLHVLAWQAGQKGLELLARVAPDVPDVALGDAGRLRQVLLNLVGNAVKFTERGSVTVVAAAAPADDGQVRLSLAVTDTGCGIEAEDRERVFHAFEQADATMTRRHGGTGLGLAIARRLVGLMGGRLEVDSAPGLGSAFRFEVLLRQAPPGATVEAPPPPPPPARRPLHVLVAEDNAVNRTVALGLLQHQGHTAEAACDGHEALRLLQTRRYDVVLMDVQMPEMDGLETTRAWRQREAGSGRRLPILALTAHALAADRERCLQAGMDGFLTKPVHPDDLARALADVEGPADVPRGRAAEDEAAPGGAAGTSALDTGALLKRCAGDEGLARQLVGLFLDDAPRQAAAARAALAAGDAKALQRAAHTLKGGAGTFAAAGTVVAASRLEEIGKGGRLDGAADALAALEAELARLVEALTAWRGDGTEAVRG